MFGYIGIDDKAGLSSEGLERYRAAYCGLCHALGERFGNIGRLTLTYDMTFVYLLLSSLYMVSEAAVEKKCVRRPFRGRVFPYSPAMPYAADMNIYLAYYQALDDINDDYNMIARYKGKLIEKHLPEVVRRNPRQCGVIKNALERLSSIERSGELNPDIPANSFGELLGEVFVWREDEYAGTLRNMGAALGRFIYLLDAANDLRADLKKRRYNPLSGQVNTDFSPVLTMLIGECASEFEKLPLKRDIDLLRNIIYSGVWIKFKHGKEINKI